MNNENAKIPTSKIRRAGKFVRTGVKVGGNYLKAYSKKLVTGELDQESLDEKNAADIYDTLSNLKGSALKVAQMLSMDRGILPEAFSKQFTKAQSKAPPLSSPLIIKTFRQFFGQSPSELFDRFDLQAKHAASIGQVHQAEKDGKKLAVKIQYPGVADSVVSDLKIVRPIARRMFGWKDRDIATYFEEVQARLVEETDYELELERSMLISQQCKDLPNLKFAQYYPKLSAERVITMDWLDGRHLDELLASNPSQEIRDRLGQALWDFYNFQIHHLKMIHADAHPGNFLFDPSGKVAILDFGCVKVIPERFYQLYFRMLNPELLNDEAAFIECCRDANLLSNDDSPEEIKLYSGIFKEALSLVCRPFYTESFDFGNEAFFDDIYAYGDRMSRNPALRNSRIPRGDKDGIYLNRTYFGLFSILNQLGARINTQRFMA